MCGDATRCPEELDGDTVGEGLQKKSGLTVSNNYIG